MNYLHYGGYAIASINLWTSFGQEWIFFESQKVPLLYGNPKVYCKSAFTVGKFKSFKSYHNFNSTLCVLNNYLPSLNTVLINIIVITYH